MDSLKAAVDYSKNLDMSRSTYSSRASSKQSSSSKNSHARNNNKEKETTQITASNCKNKIEEYKRAFNFFDANNDGRITIDELEKAMQKCGQRPTKLELRLIMYHGDNDQNGVITFDEFAHLMNGTASMNQYTYDQLREQFDMFDKDKDGFIEKMEMLSIVRELSLQASFPRQVVEQLFNEADIDGDGKISFEEFVLAVN
ncbi:hypothetical protein GCK72_024743 [Caenorhabditis remanei]|uniref:EF-hand domain-containing protein n=1 Tax=Caenorhabditis remanei TaxID=31234 RepID=A0A6A5G024_CAERE|nr:hypothetical protein GCK72_024743 [Caenorhabditis remanei]KAF1748276.1 hypothetical protein GCK72_024743 [Caenorhabditis remanei]